MRSYIIYRIKRLLRRLQNNDSLAPFLGDRPYGGPKESSNTFVAVVREGFNIDFPNANSTIRLGLCHGFAQIGIRYYLVNVFELKKVLPRLQNPFVLLSVHDYLDLNKATCRFLRNYRHFVWVQPDYEAMKIAYQPYGIRPEKIPNIVFRRILESEPTFVFAMAPPSSLEFYSTWNKLGLRLEAIPFACDTTRYYLEPQSQKYCDVRVAFVGGYWPKKAIQFEKYLRPYEDILTVFGYSSWPYRGYQGLLPEEDEKLLYKNARVSPAISEPHAELIGDMTERVFKVLGSGGVAITDVVPSYSDLFSSDELLVPSSLEEYHDMVRQVLRDDDLHQRYRETGYRAIQERHTYAHRARDILKYLGIIN